MSLTAWKSVVRAAVILCLGAPLGARAGVSEVSHLERLVKVHAPSPPRPHNPHGPDSGPTWAGMPRASTYTHTPAREPASSPSRLPLWPQALAGSWLDRQMDAENVTDERSGLGVEQGPNEEALITMLSSALLGQTRLAGPRGRRALGPGAP